MSKHCEQATFVSTQSVETRFNEILGSTVNPAPVSVHAYRRQYSRPTKASQYRFNRSTVISQKLCNFGAPPLSHPVTQSPNNQYPETRNLQH